MSVCMTLCPLSTPPSEEVMGPVIGPADSKEINNMYWKSREICQNIPKSAFVLHSIHFLDSYLSKLDFLLLLVLMTILSSYSPYTVVDVFCVQGAVIGDEDRCSGWVVFNHSKGVK